MDMTMEDTMAHGDHSGSGHHNGMHDPTMMPSMMNHEMHLNSMGGHDHGSMGGGDSDAFCTGEMGMVM